MLACMYVCMYEYTQQYAQQYRKSVGVDRRLEEEHEAEIQQALLVHDQYIRNIAVGRAVAALENVTQWTSYKTALGGQVHPYILMFVNVYVCVYICIYIDCVYVRMLCVCIYIYILREYMYMYIYSHTHTYIHIPLRSIHARFPRWVFKCGNGTPKRLCAVSAQWHRGPALHYSM
jgi:hypothetical protein